MATNEVSDAVVKRLHATQEKQKKRAGYEEGYEDGRKWAEKKAKWAELKRLKDQVFNEQRKEHEDPYDAYQMGEVFRTVTDHPPTGLKGIPGHLIDGWWKKASHRANDDGPYTKGWWTAAVDVYDAVAAKLAKGGAK